jgi:hypothetical protein
MNLLLPVFASEILPGKGKPANMHIWHLHQLLLLRKMPLRVKSVAGAFYCIDKHCLKTSFSTLTRKHLQVVGALG